MNQYSVFTSTAGNTVTQTTYDGNPNNGVNAVEVKTKPLANVLNAEWTTDTHYTGDTYYVDGVLYSVDAPVDPVTLHFTRPPATPAGGGWGTIVVGVALAAAAAYAMGVRL